MRRTLPALSIHYLFGERSSSSQRHGEHIADGIAQAVSEHTWENAVGSIAQPSGKPAEDTGDNKQWPEVEIGKKDERVRNEKDEGLQRVADEEAEVLHQPSAQQPPEEDLFS